MGADVGAEGCQWALTEKRTLRGGGALQLLDLRLFEDGGERGGALVSNVVGRDTASDGQDGNGERGALTERRTLYKAEQQRT